MKRIGAATAGALAILVAFSVPSCGGRDGGGGGPAQYVPFVLSVDRSDQFGYSSPCTTSGVAVDNAGNIYVAGQTGPTRPGNSDTLLRKYSPTLQFLWEKQAGSDQSEEVAAVAVDRQGRVILAGPTYGGWFDNNIGGKDIFVARFDPSGNMVDNVQFGSSFSEDAFGVALDDSGNVYVAGETVGSLFAENEGVQDAFVAKRTAALLPEWGSQFGTPGRDLARGIASGTSGNLYAVGQTHGDLFGGGNPDPDKLHADMWIRRYDASGAPDPAWDNQVGTVLSDIAYAVATDASGNVYVAGETEGDLFGQNADNTTTDAFLMKLGPGGNRIWGKQFGTPQADQAFALAVGPGGNVYVAGYTKGDLYGNNKDASHATSDIFVAVFGGDGAFLGAGQFGTDKDDLARGVAVDADGTCYVTGSTDGNMSGSPDPVDPKAIFIVKLKRN